MGSKILLFGSTGIIGSILKENIDVIPVTRNDCNLLDNANVISFIAKHNPDVIINCVSNTDTTMDMFNYDIFNENISIFDNLLDAKPYYGKMICFGSGAEFDRRTSIDNAKESDICCSFPYDHYGISKNIIARSVEKTNSVYNLRLFGLLSHKDKNRLFNHIFDDDFALVDRYFDYFSEKDLVTVVKYFCENTPKYNDVNMVYNEKYRLSDYIYTIYKYNKLNKKINSTKSNKNYTGSGERLSELNLPLVGINDELRKYKI